VDELLFNGKWPVDGGQRKVVAAPPAVVELEPLHAGLGGTQKNRRSHNNNNLSANHDDPDNTN